jgi:hypothetical protein
MSEVGLLYAERCKAYPVSKQSRNDDAMMGFYLEPLRQRGLVPIFQIGVYPQVATSGPGWSP